MLKGYLLANIDENKRTSANTRWRDRIRELNDAGREVEADCFKAWLRSQHATKIRERKKGAKPEDFDRIGTEFHRWLRDAADTVGLHGSDDFYRFIDRDFDFYSRQYLRILDAASRPVPGLEHVLYNAQQGFNPDVPLKPSGVPWLGDIPAHWEVRRLSIVAHFDSGKAHEQFVEPGGKHICVTARFVSTGGTTRKFCTHNFSPAKKNDVLMVMSDLPNGRALARAFLVQDDANYAVNQRVCIIRPHKMNSAFLAYQTNRNWGLLQNDDHYNQTHLSNRDYKTLPLLCPPLTEQEEIVGAVARAIRHIPLVITRTEREIALMQEYRTRLTADIVTGKLDVRTVARELGDQEAHTPAEDLQEDTGLEEEDRNHA